MLKWLYRRYLSAFKSSMLCPTYDRGTAVMVRDSGDPVRYGAIALALRRIESDGIPGDIAECGVYKGELSKFIHAVAPDRDLFLFDTFHGFDRADASKEQLVRDDDSQRFQDTTAEQVRKAVGTSEKIHMVVGRFPETASEVVAKRFAFVMIDFDLYGPTQAALEFFYPRINHGGYLFLHDYNSLESNRAVSRATTEFLAGKPELLVEIPDNWGSVAFRKM